MEPRLEIWLREEHRNGGHELCRKGANENSAVYHDSRFPLYDSNQRSLSSDMSYLNQAINPHSESNIGINKA